jgi:hypothetical protein
MQIQNKTSFVCSVSYVNHFHSVKNFLFSSAKPHDFDGMLGTGLPVSMYTTKTPIDKCRFNVTQLKEFFTFSVKDRYQLNYFITSGVYAITVTTSTYHSRRCGRL